MPYCESHGGERRHRMTVMRNTFGAHSMAGGLTDYRAIAAMPFDDASRR